MFGSDSFIFSSSSDRNARLQSAGARLTRTTEQAKRWNLKSLLTFDHPKNQYGHVQGDRKENKKRRASARLPILEDEELFDKSEPLKSTEAEADEIAKQGSTGKSTKGEPKNQPQQESQLPRIDPPQPSSGQTSSEDMVQSRLAMPQLSSSITRRKHESLFKHNLEEEFLRRIERRRNRRRVFGEINTEKDIETLTLPSNLPMTPQMISKGIVCTTQSDLQTLQLAFPDLGEETKKSPATSDRKKVVNQTKKSTLPPLVKPSRSRLSENKKSSGCRLPSVPTVMASTSLKWGKY